MGYVFLIPGFVFLGCFLVFPFFKSLVRSFTDWNAFSPDFSFVGLNEERETKLKRRRPVEQIETRYSYFEVWPHAWYEQLFVFKQRFFCFHLHIIFNSVRANVKISSLHSYRSIFVKMAQNCSLKSKVQLNSTYILRFINVVKKIAKKLTALIDSEFLCNTY